MTRVEVEKLLAEDREAKRRNEAAKLVQIAEWLLRLSAVDTFKGLWNLPLNDRQRKIILQHLFPGYHMTMSERGTMRGVRYFE